jgi:hypothetical protein
VLNKVLVPMVALLAGSEAFGNWSLVGGFQVTGAALERDHWYTGVSPSLLHGHDTKGLASSCDSTFL